MIALAHLHQDYLQLGDMIADGGVDLSPHAQQIEAMLSTVEDADWKLGGAFAREYWSTAPLWRQMADTNWILSAGQVADAASPSWWAPYWIRLQQHFFKINATENLQARVAREIQRATAADAASLLATREAYNRWAEDNLGFTLGWIYNPVGRPLLGMEAAFDFEYQLRAYDVAAMQRLVHLGFEVRLQGINPEGVLAFIAAHPQWGSHPVTGQAFIWDGNRKMLLVEPSAKHSDGRRFSVPVWTPT